MSSGVWRQMEQLHPGSPKSIFFQIAKNMSVWGVGINDRCAARCLSKLLLEAFPKTNICMKPLNWPRWTSFQLPAPLVVFHYSFLSQIIDIIMYLLRNKSTSKIIKYSIRYERDNKVSSARGTRTDISVNQSDINHIILAIDIILTTR